MWLGEGVASPPHRFFAAKEDHLRGRRRKELTDESVCLENVAGLDTKHRFAHRIGLEALRRFVPADFGRRGLVHADYGHDCEQGTTRRSNAFSAIRTRPSGR